MTNEEAMQVWANRQGLGHANYDEANIREDGSKPFAPGDILMHVLPVFDEGKGGRCWPDGHFSLRTIEALVVLGAPYTHWKRLDPQSLDEAINTLGNCANGWSNPMVCDGVGYRALKTLVELGDEPIVLEGEWCIDELQALCIVWRHAFGLL